MPRPDLTMAPAARLELLRSARTLHLASTDEEGWPEVVPLWFVHHPDPRGEVWVWNLNRARRAGRLASGARCGVSVDAGSEYLELRGLTARALPTRVEDPDVPLSVRRDHSMKYLGIDEPLATAHHHTWFALALTDERSWDFRRLVPQ